MNIINDGLKMKTKYRVKQEGNKFYPQYKKFLFWRNITFPYMSVDDYKIEQKKNCPGFIDGLYHLKNVVYYSNSLDDAEKMIDTYIECKNFNLCYKGHTIIKIYDDCRCIKYVDLSITTSSRFHLLVYPIYSENLDIVKSDIDEIKKYRKVSKIRNIYPYGKD